MQRPWGKKEVDLFEELKEENRGKEMAGAMSEWTGKLARGLKVRVPWSGSCRSSVGTSREASEALQAEDDGGQGWAAGSKKGSKVDRF